MMRRWIALLPIIAVLLLSDVSGVSAYSNVSFSFSFYDTLAPYGAWVNYSTYGRCWRPAISGFTPYTNGHWVYTSYGPTWVGHEPWSWAAYHYGQWIFTAQFGWIWVPGYEWSPGRVIWAHGPGYIGWAPYYPGFNRYDANLWVFIDGDHFGYRNYSGVRLRRDSVRNLFARRAVQIRSTKPLRSELERISGRSVRLVNVQEKSVEAGGRRARLVIPEGEEHILRRVAEVSKPKTAVSEKKTTLSRESRSSSHGKGSVSMKKEEHGKSYAVRKGYEKEKAAKVKPAGGKSKEKQKGKSKEKPPHSPKALSF